MATPDQPGRIAALDPLDAETRADIAGLLDRAESASGHPGLAEPSRLAWAGAGGDFAGLVLRSDGELAGYAQLGWRDTSWTVEIVLDPGPPGTGARRELLEAAVSLSLIHI